MFIIYFYTNRIIEYHFIRITKKKLFHTCFLEKASIIQADNPKTFRALKVVASAISSGVLFKYAAIISTVTGKEQGSFR